MDNLHDGHRLEVVHFFCSTAKSESRWNPLSTAPDILRSLIGQLLDHDIGRIATTQDILKRNQEATNNSSPTLRELLSDTHIGTEHLWQILGYVLGADEGPRIVFVLDDFHVIPVEARPGFLKRIRELWDSLRSLPRLPIKLLVTSRPYADISASLEGVPMIDQDTERKRM